MAEPHSPIPSIAAVRRELKRQYRETLRPMGVYSIRHLAGGRLYLSASLNLDAAMNRDRFQLKMNGHPSVELQAAWQQAGEAGFASAVLDRLKPREDAPDHDYRPELEALLALWRAELDQAGVSFYALAPHVKHSLR